MEANWDINATVHRIKRSKVCTHCNKAHKKPKTRQEDFSIYFSPKYIFSEKRQLQTRNASITEKRKRAADGYESLSYFMREITTVLESSNSIGKVLWNILKKRCTDTKISREKPISRRFPTTQKCASRTCLQHSVAETVFYTIQKELSENRYRLREIKEKRKKNVSFLYAHNGSHHEHEHCATRIVNHNDRRITFNACEATCGNEITHRWRSQSIQRRSMTNIRTKDANYRFITWVRHLVISNASIYEILDRHGFDSITFPTVDLTNWQ